jgi:hypothetical protein
MCDDKAPTSQVPPIQEVVSSTNASINTADDSFFMDEMGSIKSSFSEESDEPSIAPGALVSKMASVFLGGGNNLATGEQQGRYDDEKPIVPRRAKRIDPKDLPFLQSSTPGSNPNKALEEITPKPRNTPVGQGIRKFGGPRKTIVERRTEELTKKWAENKSAVLVKKVQWGKCSRTGGYKKKVVIEKEVKESK